MSYAIVPVAAVAETVATSAASFKTIAVFDDDPENVCVPVKVLSADADKPELGVTQVGAPTPFVCKT
jgi:hypothetical protein